MSEAGWLMRVYRGGLLLGLILLVHEQGVWVEAQRAASISLRTARRYFPAAVRLQLRDPERGLYLALTSSGEAIGCLLTTSPQTDDILGYAGPNNLLIALDEKGALVGLELLESGDTEEHVRRVERDPEFWDGFKGWNPGEGAAPKWGGVSGATLTSMAITEGVEQRLLGAAPSLRFPDPVKLEEVSGLFTNAAQLVSEGLRLGVYDGAGGLVGWVIRTSPQADNVSGYRGPTECLVGLGPEGRKVRGVVIRRSYDTSSYVAQVRNHEGYLAGFLGLGVEELAALDVASMKPEAVSGATLTGRALAVGLKRRFGAELREMERSKVWRPKLRDWGLGGVVAGAMVMAFTSLRGKRWARLGWQLVLVGYVGLVNHDLLSLALLGGWSENGLAWRAASGLVLLAVAALVVPWATRRQLYCHQLCPHGAAQQLLGKVLRRRWKLPVRLTRWLELLPGALLGVALLALLFGWGWDLTALEPFDAWNWGAAGTVTLGIAGVGLVASLFVPQAYCRFGCPTGALLNFVRSAGSGEHWGRRDLAALGLSVMALLTVAGVRVWPRAEPVLEPLVLKGRAMGTTWMVKIHDEIADPAVLERVIGSEFEWAESLTSHWRTNTDLSEFNRSATTNAMPVPWPVVTLSRRAAEISRVSGGAFDITVGPLVRLWGFGPGPAREEPPREDEISRVGAGVGWEKLEVQEGMLRKTDPSLEVDLSGIAKGWAIDQLTELLEQRGYTNYLVEAGGELRAKGRWVVGIEHPARFCTLTNEALASSGTYRQKFEAGGRRYSHLIDSRTGRPVAHQTVSVSVRHADCAQADAWATALNVMGAESGLPLADRLGLAAQFVVEREDGTFDVRTSRGWVKE